MIKIIGKSPINPILFFTGKLSGYFMWIILILHIFKYDLFQISSNISTKYFAYFLFFVGLILTILSLINLGNSTSLGIPSKKTLLKKKGLYKFSRNPMYLGFNILTISSIIISFNLITLILGSYSIIIYHFIILGEEKFLLKRFNKDFLKYCKKIRRYI